MIPHHACQGGHLPPPQVMQNRPRTGPSGAKPPLWLLSAALPLRVSAVNLCGTDRLPGALCRVRRVRLSEPLARFAAAIPVPLTEVSGIENRSTRGSCRSPTIPPEIGPKRPVRPHGAPPVSRPNRGRRAVRCGPKGRRMSPVWLASARHEGGSGRPNRFLSGARAPEQPLRFPPAALAGTTCGEIERVSGPVRSPSPAQLGEHRAGSGGRGGSGMRWRPRACEARRVEGGGPGQARPGCRGGPGRVRGGRGDFRSPRVPSGPGGPPPRD